MRTEVEVEQARFCSHYQRSMSIVPNANRAFVVNTVGVCYRSEGLLPSASPRFSLFRPEGSCDALLSADGTKGIALMVRKGRERGIKELGSAQRKERWPPLRVEINRL